MQVLIILLQGFFNNSLLYPDYFWYRLSSIGDQKVFPAFVTCMFYVKTK